MMLKNSKSISAFAVVSALLLSISAPAFSARLSCASGGRCVVGDAGPGGGTVYYFNRKGFNCGPSYTATGSPTRGLCHYLEVAPSTWSGGVSDPGIVWAVSGFQGSNAVGITEESSPNNSSTGIGLGYKNSDLIVTQNGAYDASNNDYAAGAARAYGGRSLTDWYLPTTAELNLIYQWKTNSRVPVEGFVTEDYWSSSECVGLADGPYDVAWHQSFVNGIQAGDNKRFDYFVRPVRAF